MKGIASLLALVGTASAHYTFEYLIADGTPTTAWEYVRQWTGYYTHDPVTTVLTTDIRCNVDGSTAFAPGILSVPAGSQLGMNSDPAIFHPGPLLAYMAKVPEGSTAANWDGSGDVWFKIFQDEPTGLGVNLVWPSDGDATTSFTIPAATPDGDYLFRVEQIALHVAQTVGGAQFYLSCGQITITGGGSGTPGPLVAFPGAYSPTDPGILIDIYYPVPTNYTPPGPPVWDGTGTGGSTGSTGPTTGTSAPSTGTSAPSTKTTLPTSITTSTSTQAAQTTPTGCQAAQFDQCGGMSYTGCTNCQAGTTCSAVSPPYYYQCLGT